MWTNIAKTPYIFAMFQGVKVRAPVPISGSAHDFVTITDFQAQCIHHCAKKSRSQYGRLKEVFAHML